MMNKLLSNTVQYFGLPLLCSGVLAAAWIISSNITSMPSSKLTTSPTELLPNATHAITVNSTTKSASTTLSAHTGELPLHNSLDPYEHHVFVTRIEHRLPELFQHFHAYASASFNAHLLAAISYQESHWDPLARSPTGVRGIMMLTRNTASQMGVDDRLDPEQSIRGGAQYLQQLYEQWPESMPHNDKILFSLAAYNMGKRHLQAIQKSTAAAGGDPLCWCDVGPQLQAMAEDNPRARQAHTFVKRVRGYYGTIRLAAGTQL